MAQIKLKKTADYENFTVKGTDFGFIKLFKKYNHTYTPKQKQERFSQGDIYLCKDDRCIEKFTLKRSVEYEGKSLEYVTVYFNKYMLTIPLLLILPFKDVPSHKRRCFNLFDIYSELQEKNISTLDEYKGEHTILQKLINENDKIDGLLTFRIDLKDISSGGLYNNRKIQVTDDSTNIQELIGKGFKKYKHTPQPTEKVKNACVIFDNNVLLQNNGTPLLNIQNKPYGYLNVYWSNKVDIPLLLEINIDRQDVNKNEFYCHNLGGVLFWEKLEKNNFKRYTGHDLEQKRNIYHELTYKGNEILFKLLGKLEFDLLNILFLLIYKKNGNYGESDVRKTLGYHARLLSYKNKVSVVDLSNTVKGNCFNKSGFKVYEHDFTDAIDNTIDSGSVKIKFIKSNIESVEKEYLTIKLDRELSDRFMFKSHEVLVSNAYNNPNRYTWFKHSSEGKITTGIFYLSFKGQTLRMNNDLSEKEASNQIVIVYFKTGETDRFILLAFPTDDQYKIRYLSYDMFKKSVKTGAEIRLSTLSPASVSVKYETDDSGNGQTMDDDLVQLLNDEYEKNYSVRIEIDRRSGQNYKYGSLEIAVSEQKNYPDQDFDEVEHSFEVKDHLYNIVLHQNNYSIILDLSEFLGIKIRSVSFYFHKSNQTTPLIMCITTDGTEKKYVRCVGFFFRLGKILKYSDLELVNGTSIKSELGIHYYNIIHDIILDIFSTQNYPGFNVSSPNPYGNYNYYTHTPIQYFKNVKFKERSLYKFTGFKISNYTYSNLLYINVFYHTYDKENLYPLIVEFYTKNYTRENLFEYKSSYYCLSEISINSCIKTYKMVELKGKTFTNQLNDLYSNFKKKIDTDLRLNDSDIVDYLLYSKSKTKLYVYFYKDDPRPLLICYEGKAYKRYFIYERDSKWIQLSSLNKCLCEQNQVNLQIISVLNQLAESLSLIQLKPAEKEDEASVEIDLSIKDTIYGKSKNVIASNLEEFPGCNVFTYCIHSIKTHSSFKMISFKIGKPESLIKTLNEPMTNIISVKVYFNKFSSEKPVLLEFILDDGKRKYLKDLGKEKTSYDASSVIDLNEFQLVDRLIEESDRINNRLTYQIDKGPNHYKNITFIKQSSEGVITYAHTSRRGISKLYDVLYKNKLLVCRTGDRFRPTEEIKNKNYNEIRVYSLDSDPNFPLLAQFKDSKTNSYILKRDQNGLYWMQEQFSFIRFSLTRDKLIEIKFLLKKSIIVEISNKPNSAETFIYEMKHIENTPGSDGKIPKNTNYSSSTKTHPVKNIHVKDVTSSCNSLNENLFKCYSHDISALKGSPESNDIGGLRFYIKIPGRSNPVEIQLYDGSGRNKNRIFSYYRPNETVAKGIEESNKIKAFFHKYNDLPLMICYKDKAYKRIKTENHFEWYNDSSISISASKLLNTLKSIYSDTKKKMLFLKDENINDNVNTITNHISSSFKKVSYFANVQSHQLNSNYRISKDRLNSGIVYGSRLDTLFESLYNIRFDSINLYMNKNGSSINDIFVFEFINESSKTHFQKIDNEGKFWVEEAISGSIDNGKLTNIKSQSDNTVIYEISSNSRNDGMVNIQSNPKNPVDGFEKCTHSLKNVSDKTTIILYNNDKLNEKRASKYQEITELDKQRDSTVVVYLSEKIKCSGLGSQKKVPLIIEFAKKKKSNELDYYIHRYDPTEKRNYWEKIIGSTLKNLLIEMNFGMKNGEPGYNHLKNILTTTTVIKTAEKIDNLSSKFSGIKNNQLKSLLEQKVGQGGSENPTLLVLLLKKIEFELVESVVILVEKSSECQYNEIDVNDAVSNLNPQKEMNFVNMKSKNINVTDVTEKQGQCIKQFNYRIMCHNISQVTTALGKESQNSISIRFVIPTINNKYKLITLYSDEKTEPQNVDYIYHSNNQNEIYVYFYGEDPRPLMLCYGTGAYKPMNLGDPEQNTQVRVNYSRWVKVTSINSCVCSEYHVDGQKEKLVQALTDVVGYLNNVQINPMQIPTVSSRTITTSYITDEYMLHRYTKTIAIKIGIHREELTCYKKFTYQPNGTNNRYTEKFRLGTVLHHDTNTGKLNGTLDYTKQGQAKYQPLKTVSVYYYKHDNDFINPLLLMLEFGGQKEYYKLLNKNSNYQWSLLDLKLMEGDKLYDELFLLNETFNKNNSVKPPDKKECVPGDSTPAIASSTVTLAIAGGGTGFAIYKYPHVVLSLISKIIPK